MVELYGDWFKWGWDGFAIDCGCRVWLDAFVVWNFDWFLEFFIHGIYFWEYWPVLFSNLSSMLTAAFEMSFWESAQKLSIFKAPTFCPVPISTDFFRSFTWFSKAWSSFLFWIFSWSYLDKNLLLLSFMSFG